MTTALVPKESVALSSFEGELSIEYVIAQKRKVQQCMKEVMHKDEHYGVIPGTSGKPSLLKAGAETLCFMFRLDPQYEILQATERPDFIAFTVRCTLYHIPTGQRVASGLGSCNSREAKYVRPAPKKCPNCGKEAIIKGKEEYGGGWLCFGKKGGCGGKWKDGAAEIEQQPAGIADPSDLHNTLIKMACKRSHVAATLAGTAASDFFTQDLEDLAERQAEYAPPAQQARGRGAAANTSPAPGGAGRTPPPSHEGEVIDAEAEENGARFRSAMEDEPRAATTAPRGRTKGDYLPGDKVPARLGAPQATHAQLAEIHVLQKEIGWPDWEGEPKWTASIDVWPTYRKAIGAYRKVDNSRCCHANELQEHQADNLLKRMRAQRDRNGSKLAAMEAEAVANVQALGGSKARPQNLADALQDKISSDSDERDFLAELGFDSREDIANDLVPDVLACLMAWGTPKFDAERVKTLQKWGALGRR